MTKPLSKFHDGGTTAHRRLQAQTMGLGYWSAHDMLYPKRLPPRQRQNRWYDTLRQVFEKGGRKK